VGGRAGWSLARRVTKKHLQVLLAPDLIVGSTLSAHFSSSMRSHRNFKIYIFHIHVWLKHFVTGGAQSR